MEDINYIKAEIEIKEIDIDKKIRIINSFEETKREEKWSDKEDDYKYENEKEIKNCKIIINGKKISFTYFYIFKEKGKYFIEYLFTDDIIKINHIFYKCNSLTNIDLSNLNTQNITDMTSMFSGCIL